MRTGGFLHQMTGRKRLKSFAQDDRKKKAQKLCTSSGESYGSFSGFGRGKVTEEKTKHPHGMGKAPTNNINQAACAATKEGSM
jgi:hypothetical protein